MRAKGVTRVTAQSTSLISSSGWRARSIMTPSRRRTLSMTESCKRWCIRSAYHLMACAGRILARMILWWISMIRIILQRHWTPMISTCQTPQQASIRNQWYKVRILTETCWKTAGLPCLLMTRPALTYLTIWRTTFLKEQQKEESLRYISRWWTTHPTSGGTNQITRSRIDTSKYINNRVVTSSCARTTWRLTQSCPTWTKHLPISFRSSSDIRSRVGWRQ